MASLILATMRVKSLEYIVRHKASRALAASPAERSDTRVSAPAATDLWREVRFFYLWREGGNWQKDINGEYLASKALRRQSTSTLTSWPTS